VALKEFSIAKSHIPKVLADARWLVLLGGIIGLLLAEGAARLWVAFRWHPDEKYSLTHHTPVRGRFAYDPELGYVLSSDYRSRQGHRTHNSLGLRGGAIAATKGPGTGRIMLIGASTAYGEAVSDSETSSAQLEILLRQSMPARPVEVLNGGVPGWTSAETAASFPGRIKPLAPDVLIVLDGRNDVFPQLFDNYRDDYSHYRRPGHDFRDSNYWYKWLFRISYLAMIVCTNGGGHLGFSETAEHPLYASIRYENRPSLDDMRTHAADPKRSEGYRRNLQRIIHSARANAIEIVLVTIPFRTHGYRSNVIPRNPAALPLVSAMVRRNQEITREVAKESNVVLVDAAARLSTGEYLEDDCHLNRAGERALAGMLSAAIRPLLEARAGKRQVARL
jgi:lysophospholipase L1-like esterase